MCHDIRLFVVLEVVHISGPALERELIRHGAWMRHEVFRQSVDLLSLRTTERCARAGASSGQRTPEETAGATSHAAWWGVDEVPHEEAVSARRRTTLEVLGWTSSWILLVDVPVRSPYVAEVQTWDQGLDETPRLWCLPWKL
jgi:hypothetical protein